MRIPIYTYRNMALITSALPYGKWVGGDYVCYLDLSTIGPAVQKLRKHSPYVAELIASHPHRELKFSYLGTE